MAGRLGGAGEKRRGDREVRSKDGNCYWGVGLTRPSTPHLMASGESVKAMAGEDRVPSQCYQ